MGQSSLKFVIALLLPVAAWGATESINVNTLDGKVKQTSSGVGATPKPFNFSDVSVTGLSVTAAPGGSNTNVQFNDSGVLAGDADFIWNKTTNLLTLNGSISLTNPGAITGNGAVPTGGTATQVLTKNTGTNYDYSWSAAPAATPGGSSGQFQYNLSGAFAGNTNLNRVGGTVEATAGFFYFVDSSDTTKKMRFDLVTNVPTATTETVIVPNHANPVLVAPDAGASNNFLTGITANGVITKAQPSISNISGLATGMATWLGTPSSANLRATVTDENGTGALLFSGATTPDFTTGFTIGGVAATSGKILIGNGTNYVPSTPTYPNAASTSGKHIKSDGTNFVTTTATISDAPGTAGKILISDATNWITSTPTFPNASATTGKFIRSDGTNWIASTPTLPTTAGTAGKILRSDGTNYVETTATFPATAGTSGNVLTSDGTNWSSAAPTGGAGTPGGADTQLQYNNAGAFGGIATATYSNSTGALSLGSGGTNQSLTLKGSGTGTVIIGNSGSVGDVVLTTVNGSIGNRTINFGGNYDQPAIVLYDGGATARFGWGLRGGEMQFYAPTANHFSWNKGGDFQASGTNEVMRLDNNSMVLSLASNGTLGFSSTSVSSGTVDTGIIRNSAGILEVNNGTAGSYRDLKARNIDLQSSGIITGNGTVPTGGTTGQVLKKNTNTNYDVSWAAAGAAGAGGSDTQVQFNSSGVLNGDSNFIWDNTNKVLSVSGNTGTSTLRVGTLEVQDYSLSNAWIGENAYYNAGFKYRATGPAALFYFKGDEGQFRLAASGTAGTALPNVSGTGDSQLKVNADGTVAIGGAAITGNNGSYTNSKLLVKGGTSAINIASDYVMGWSSTSGDASASLDTALSRNSAGLVEINNGTAGQYRDLRGRTIDANSGFTIAGVGTASGKIMQSDGTKFTNSTPAYPTAVGTAGYTMRSDGSANFAMYPQDMLNSSTADDASFSTSDRYVAGSAVTVAAGDFKAKGQYHCVFDMVKSAGTGTIVITVRIGTAGTTGDTSRMTFTMPGAGTSVADTGIFEVWVNWRTVGSGTSAVVSGMCKAAKNTITAAGLWNTTTAVVPIVGTTSGGFDSSAATTIGLSFNGSTAFAGTNKVVQATLIQ